MNAAAAALARQELIAARWPHLQQHSGNSVESPAAATPHRSANKVIEIPDDDDEMESKLLSEVFGQAGPIVID